MIYLCLGVWARPWKPSIPAEFCHLSIELMCQDDGERHAGLGLICRIAKHQALVTGTNVILITPHVHSLSNVGRLFLEGGQHIARLVVKACNGGEMGQHFSTDKKATLGHIDLRSRFLKF
jgi:hypothetical protein